MITSELVEILLNRPGVSAPPPDSQAILDTAAEQVVQNLLAETPLSEATVRLPPRGTIWIATFTGPSGGQVWRSTGSTDRDQALATARKWEAEARAKRARSGSARKPTIRVRRSQRFTGNGPLTQREVAALLGMSERGVREVERRAFRKILSHPLMRRVWRQYVAGRLDENQPILSSAEVEAVLNAARTPEESRVIRKVLEMIQR